MKRTKPRKDAQVSQLVLFVRYGIPVMLQGVWGATDIQSHVMSREVQCPKKPERDRRIFMLNWDQHCNVERDPALLWAVFPKPR